MLHWFVIAHRRPTLVAKLTGTQIINGVVVNFDGVTIKGRSAPLVVCPGCGKERRLTHQNLNRLRNGGSALCKECGRKVQAKAIKGRLIRTDDQVLPTRSIIHWSQRDRSNPNRAMVTCGLCGETRMTSVMRSPRWTGYCPKHARSGSEHQHWKGGRIDSGDGYILVHLDVLGDSDRSLAEPMTTQKTYVLEHRLVVARMIGRPLRDDELVHHVNGDKTDNRPANLRLVSRQGHPAENKITVDTLKAEIARLQAILDEHHIAY
jgi:hypothetical protein